MELTKPLTDKVCRVNTCQAATILYPSRSYENIRPTKVREDVAKAQTGCVKPCPKSWQYQIQPLIKYNPIIEITFHASWLRFKLGQHLWSRNWLANSKIRLMKIFCLQTFHRVINFPEHVATSGQDVMRMLGSIWLVYQVFPADLRCLRWLSG